MRTIVILLIAILAQQHPFPVGVLTVRGSSGPPPSCTSPGSAAFTNEWDMWTATNSGGNITGVADSVASNNLAPSATGPGYSGGAFGTRAGANFSSSTDTTLLMGTPFSGNQVVSIFAIVKPTLTGSPLGIFGSTGSTSDAFYYRINSSGKQEVVESFIQVAGTGTSTLTSGSAVAIGASYNGSTGAYTFYKFSGGSYATDGTGTGASGISFAGNTTGVGHTELFNGQILLVAPYVGTWNTTQLGQIATYSQCLGY